jgi:hypothetical protein
MKVKYICKNSDKRKVFPHWKREKQIGCMTNCINLEILSMGHRGKKCILQHTPNGLKCCTFAFFIIK